MKKEHIIALESISGKQKQIKEAHEHKGGKQKTPDFIYDVGCFDPKEYKKNIKYK